MGRKGRDKDLEALGPEELKARGQEEMRGEGE